MLWHSSTEAVYSLLVRGSSLMDNHMFCLAVTFDKEENLHQREAGLRVLNTISMYWRVIKGEDEGQV